MEFELLRYPDVEKLVFVRLSYDDEHLPRSKSGRASLRYSDVQKFIDLLRKRQPEKFKWMCGCEYGTKPTPGNPPRPHYHLILAGITRKWNPWVEPNARKRERFDREIRRHPKLGKFVELHGVWQLLLSCWQWRGQIDIREVDPAKHPRYIAAYITKRSKDAEGYYIGHAPGDDRERERFRMGRGVGGTFVPIIADMLRKAKRYPRGWPSPGPEWAELDLMVNVNGRTLWLDPWMKKEVALLLCPERTDEWRREFADRAHREAYVERPGGMAFDSLADLAASGPTKEKPPPVYYCTGNPGGDALHHHKVEVLELETDMIIPRSQAEVDKENRIRWRRLNSLKATEWRKSTKAS